MQKGIGIVYQLQNLTPASKMEDEEEAIERGEARPWDPREESL